MQPVTPPEITVANPDAVLTAAAISVLAAMLLAADEDTDKEAK